jgi:hypothetical protein
LARFLEEQKVYPSTGNKHWSKAGVTGMIKNPVYLGQARSGKHVKEARTSRSSAEPSSTPLRRRKRCCDRETVRSPRRRFWAA